MCFCNQHLIMSNLESKIAKIRTKARRVAIDLRGQTVSVGSNPNGRKQTYANIIANNSRNDVVCEASRTWVDAKNKNGCGIRELFNEALYDLVPKGLSKKYDRSKLKHLNLLKICYYYQSQSTMVIVGTKT